MVTKGRLSTIRAVSYLLAQVQAVGAEVAAMIWSRTDWSGSIGGSIVGS